MSTTQIHIRLTSLLDQTSKELMVTQNDFLIGRGDSCHVRLKVPSVSRQHCLMHLRSNGKLHFKDLRPETMGLLHNGVFEASGNLSIGDELVIGDIKLELLDLVAGSNAGERQPLDLDGPPDDRNQSNIRTAVGVPAIGVRAPVQAARVVVRAEPPSKRLVGAVAGGIVLVLALAVGWVLRPKQATPEPTGESVAVANDSPELAGIKSRLLAASVNLAAATKKLQDYQAAQAKKQLETTREMGQLVDAMATAHALRQNTASFERKIKAKQAELNQITKETAAETAAQTATIALLQEEHLSIAKQLEKQQGAGH